MLMLTGCSKDSESMGTKDNTELTKEQIVGVWRSGDYWVSFSEDGYCSAFFSVNGDERILEGDFKIKNDTVIVEHSMYYGNTKITINDVSQASLKLTIIFNYYIFTLFDKDDQEIKVPITLTKSSDTPVEKIAGLEGMTFSNDVQLEEGGTSYLITQSNTISEKYHSIYYINDYHGNIPPSHKGGLNARGQKYYVYLPPYIYTSAGTPGGAFEPNEPILKFLFNADKNTIVEM